MSKVLTLFVVPFQCTTLADCMMMFYCVTHQSVTITPLYLVSMHDEQVQYICVYVFRFTAQCIRRPLLSRFVYVYIIFVYFSNEVRPYSCYFCQLDSVQSKTFSMEAVCAFC